ncbi:choice-of-anchor I family protein [Neptuniibacter sp.]|uniref:choice-of-anchor I family protein n=1 Tax=Neptuniibacter sp. TaxID=1962643 RepID=UPI00260D8466|nr:choice-of-anchor I family protein [Neptuniibacter sp.]MCP4597569.1 DUF4214 domain-containing protein [Neptuniibacter sp.]
MDILRTSFQQIFDSQTGEGGSEVVAQENGRLYVTNGEEGKIDIFDAVSGELVKAIDLTVVKNYDGVNSVAIKNGLIAVAIESSDAQEGSIALFDAENGILLSRLDAKGVLPDMLTFTPDGQKILVAIEAEPVEGGVDPEGGVAIVDLSDGLVNAAVTLIDFTQYDGQEDTLREQGIRIFPGNSASQDFEPEYIAVSPDGTQAFVSLQENNAVAVIDIETATVAELLPLGTTDHSISGNGLDASNKDDAINIDTYPIFGMRMPDALTSFEIDGTTYFATANEGDARDEDERIKDLTLDETAFPNAAELQDEAVLGRLKVSTVDGDTDGDGDYDQLFSYGSRSFTIYDADGNEIFDSGDQFQQILAQIRPEKFNQDDGEVDGRSDDKGPEPEAIAVGAVGDSHYAFIGLERDNGIMVYNITDPANSEYIGYIDAEEYGNLSPEVIQFIDAENSTSGTPQLAVAFEVSGTTALINLDQLGDSTTAVSYDSDSDAAFLHSVYHAVLDREADADELGAWVNYIEDNNFSEIATIEAFLNSSEKLAQGVTSNTEFIEGLYQNVLGRDSDTDGLNAWVNYLDSGASRAVAVNGFINSEENQINLVGMMTEGVEYTLFD